MFHVHYCLNTAHVFNLNATYIRIVWPHTCPNVLHVYSQLRHMFVLSRILTQLSMCYPCCFAPARALVLPYCYRRLGINHRDLRQWQNYWFLASHKLLYPNKPSLYFFEDRITKIRLCCNFVKKVWSFHKFSNNVCLPLLQFILPLLQFILFNFSAKYYVLTSTKCRSINRERCLYSQ